MMCCELEDGAGRPRSRRRGMGKVGKMESHGTGGKGKNANCLKQVNIMYLSCENAKQNHIGIWVSLKFKTEKR